jgi:hypothetical protein
LIFIGIYVLLQTRFTKETNFSIICYVILTFLVCFANGIKEYIIKTTNITCHTPSATVKIVRCLPGKSGPRSNGNDKIAKHTKKAVIVEKISSALLWRQVSPFNAYL